MSAVIEDRRRNNTVTLIRVRIGFRIASRSVRSTLIAAESLSLSPSLSLSLCACLSIVVEATCRRGFFSARSWN